MVFKKDEHIGALALAKNVKPPAPVLNDVIGEDSKHFADYLIEKQDNKSKTVDVQKM